jgi:hypothetical protein
MQALPCDILCSIGIAFNFICDEMLVGVSDERAGARCLQIFSFACWMPAAPDAAL